MTGVVLAFARPTERGGGPVVRSSDSPTVGVTGQGRTGGRGGLRGSGHLPPSAEQTGKGGEVAAAIGVCEHETCGHAQTGPGHPRRGWIAVKVAGEDAKVWCCSWYCIGRYALRRELGAAA